MSKSGEIIRYSSSPLQKLGGGRVPPHPPRIDALADKRKSSETCNLLAAWILEGETFPF
jgi:hypothetical protein